MNIQNRKQIEKIENNEYFNPTKFKFLQKHGDLVKAGLSHEKAMIAILDFLYDIFTLSQTEVEKVIERRVTEGKVKDADQTRKAVGGYNFQRLVAYSLLKNIEIGNLPNDIIATMTTSSNKIVEEYATIETFGETQKPDVDILVYHNDIKKNTLPIVVFSCKTSMRERAGQTYKWKLLLDIATTPCQYIAKTPECPHNKYKIKYENKRKVHMCFVTSDLYNEIYQPQIAGMFSFFDKAYVTKPTMSSLDNIEKFSGVIDFLNNIFRSDTQR